MIKTDTVLIRTLDLQSMMVKELNPSDPCVCMYKDVSYLSPIL